MSSGVLSALVRSGSVLIPSLAIIAGSPSQAFAGGRDRDRCDDRPRYRDRCDDRGSRSSFSISIGDCGTSFSAGYRDGYRGGYGGYRNDWCDSRPRYVAPVYCPPPVRYCPPPVVYAPAYCPPPVVVRSEPVYVERPVYVDRPVVVERPVVVQTVSAPVPPAPVPAVVASSQDRDLGTTYLRLGDLDNAARLYQRYLGTYSNDAFAQRGLGLVELGRGNALEGSRWIAAAYRAERTLAVSPPSPEGVGGTAVYQRMLDTAVAQATRAPSPEGWLSVAILQHGTGQRDAALQSLQRARETGLDVSLLDAMTAAVAR
jgi:hypothetical protein